MFMAPIVRAEAAPAPVALRRLVGVPVLAIAGLVVVPWMLAVGLASGAVLAVRVGIQAVAYAGTLALGR